MTAVNQVDGVHQRPIVIIAMKGHPGSGKTTLACSIAKALKCPLIDKDHFRDCTKELEQTLMLSTPDQHQESSKNLLNELSYQVMWQVASTQLSLGLSVVIDSPLSRPAHLDRLIRMAVDNEARLVIVECKPKNQDEWRRRIEMRGEEADVQGSSSWHKPRSWHDMGKLLEGYAGCWEYDVGDVPKIVVDTTPAELGIEEMASSVIEFVKSCKTSTDAPCRANGLDR
ncbi:OLC1v1024599C1 [Oldenlandia corymbosa var. corymbosa]|uniref:OLC1v1024599C1 n=1 Tax=Oldenlandia corymbosa var. corymbosa TaxID=529605 RepID=A0AAV1C347_OLDCO|nr:OLC1v1024599C1 [Oldenlandia corymbosa var. corymbosa]